MSWQHRKLSYFIQTVPICRTPIELEKIRDLLQESQKSALILLGSKDCLCGVIEVKRVLKIPKGSYLPLAEIITPAQLCYEFNTVEQFLANFQENTLYVVGDRQNRCLGMLDPWLLLKHIQQKQQFSEKKQLELSIPLMTIGQSCPIVYQYDLQDDDELTIAPSQPIQNNNDSHWQRLSRNRDELLSYIGHELKSPITTVVGFANLLIQQKIGTLNPKQKQYIQALYTNAQQLMSLVNNFLDLTNLDNGEISLQLSLVNIRQICESSYAAVVAKKRNFLPFKLEIEPAIKEFEADSLKVQQILIYLFDKATNFGEQTEEFGLNVSKKGDWLVFDIWDQQELCQSSSNTLNLYLAQQFTILHGGDLSFTFKANEGNHSVLLLPISQTSNLEISQSLALIADSTDQITSLISPLLKKLGYCVTIAKTGTEALDKIRCLRPAIIFMSPLLSVLSIWDLLKLIKADSLTNKLKIVVVAEALYQKQAYQLEVDAFAELPLQPMSIERILIKFNSSFSTTSLKEKYLTVLHLHNTDSLIQLKKIFSDIPVSFSVLEATDLEQANLIIQIWHVDLIILDLKDNVYEYLYLLSISPLCNFYMVTFDRKLFELSKNFPNFKISYGLVDFLSTIQNQ